MRGKAKTAPRIWVARGRICPNGGALWGRAQPNRDSTPPTSSASLYRLNHSKSLVDEIDEPHELVTCVGRGLVVIVTSTLIMYFHLIQAALYVE